MMLVIRSVKLLLTQKSVFKNIPRQFSKLHFPGKSIQIDVIRKMSSSDFNDALQRVKTLKKNPGNETKLKLYGLFKQATEGTCSTEKPSALDFVGKAKWEAWNSLGTISQEQARIQYISLVNELCANEATKESKPSSPAGKYEGLTYSVEKDYTQITFSRPEKKNAITIQMYKDIASALKEASENDTGVTILTGAGDYYSSGNDLSNFGSALQEDLASAAKNGAVILKEFVAAFIDFPKILVAAVNGPAVGIPVTLLGLCDVVYASDKATFYTPFSLLGQSPEGCSTYTFPKIMGNPMANDVLLFNKKLTASEAKSVGLVSDIFPHASFMEDVKKRLAFLPEASKQSMIISKKLIRQIEREILHKVNADECDQLVERWQSPDCMEAIMRFFQKKSKM